MLVEDEPVIPILKAPRSVCFHHPPQSVLEVPRLALCAARARQLYSHLVQLFLTMKDVDCLADLHQRITAKSAESKIRITAIGS